MAKLKEWEKAQNWKHVLSVKSNHKKPIPTRKRRFDILKFRKLVHHFIDTADKGIGFPYGKRGEHMVAYWHGVSFDYRNMTYEIRLQDGVKLAKTF